MSSVVNILRLFLQIEERINIDTLEALKKTFSEADTNKSGQLELDEFKILLKSKLAVSGNRVSNTEGFCQQPWYRIVHLWLTFMASAHVSVVYHIIVKCFRGITLFILLSFQLLLAKSTSPYHTSQY